MSDRLKCVVSRSRICQNRTRKSLKLEWHAQRAGLYAQTSQELQRIRIDIRGFPAVNQHRLLEFERLLYPTPEVADVVKRDLTN